MALQSQLTMHRHNGQLFKRVFTFLLLALCLLVFMSISQHGISHPASLASSYGADTRQVLQFEEVEATAVNEGMTVQIPDGDFVKQSALRGLVFNGSVKPDGLYPDEFAAHLTTSVVNII